MSKTTAKGAKGMPSTNTAAVAPRMRPAEAKKWVTGLKIILDGINQHRAEFFTPEFPTTGKIHGNISPQTVGTSYLNLALKGVAAGGSIRYRPDPTSQPFNIAFQSTAWLRHALDIKNSTSNFADNKDRLAALDRCIKNAKRIDVSDPSVIPARAKDHDVAAHDALLIPISYVDDLESFIFVLADLCMRNSKTYRRLSEFPTPRWIMDPVSHAALIEKELILEHGICAWEHEPEEFAIFSKLFEDLVKHLKRARDAERMYQTIDEAVRCGNRWSTSPRPDAGVDGQRQQLQVRRRIEVGRVYAFFVEGFNAAIKQIGRMDYGSE